MSFLTWHGIDFSREIIDESDVYIDIHKAIRRMAPAPKARVARGNIVANPDTPAIPEDHLLDLDDESTPSKDAQAPRLVSVGGKNNATTMFSTSPKTTLLKRSHSNNADGQPSNAIPVRTNVADVREHLKHLGPSNLASRPRTTRYNTVKIKPGINSQGTTPEPGTRQSIAEEPYRDEPTIPAVQGGEGEGLLKSAGKEASDGVQAVQQGYGTTSTPTSRPQSSGQASRHAQIVLDGEQDWSNKRSSSGRPSTRTGESLSSKDDILTSLPSREASPVSRKRRVAHSGSITENIIDAGGIRKVILETNDSSDDVGLPGGISVNGQQDKGSADLGDDSSQRNSSAAHSEEVKKKQKKKRKNKKRSKD